MNEPAVASVIVPAHDEQAVIGATLRALLDGNRGVGPFEIVVVCNGCSDSTAEVARAVAAERAGVEVVEIAAASKIAALREGDRRASVFPRIYLDADVQLSADAARALAAALHEPGIAVAGVRARIDTSGASRFVRWYYDFRQRLPVFQHGIMGAGVYALSERGRSRFGAWPEVLGDDQFVFRLFAAEERVTVAGHRTVVGAPADLRTIVRRGVRVRRGNRDLTDGTAAPALPAPPAGIGVAVRDAVRSPAAWPGMVTWLATNTLIRVLTRVRPGSGDWRATRSSPDRGEVRS